MERILNLKFFPRVVITLSHCLNNLSAVLHKRTCICEVKPLCFKLLSPPWLRRHLGNGQLTVCSRVSQPWPCGVFSSLPGLHPLDASCDKQNCLQTLSPGGQNCSWWRTVALQAAALTVAYHGHKRCSAVPAFFMLSPLPGLLSCSCKSQITWLKAG